MADLAPVVISAVTYFNSLFSHLAPAKTDETPSWVNDVFGTCDKTDVFELNEGDMKHLVLAEDLTNLLAVCISFLAIMHTLLMQRVWTGRDGNKPWTLKSSVYYIYYSWFLVCVYVWFVVCYMLTIWKMTETHLVAEYDVGTVVMAIVSMFEVSAGITYCMTHVAWFPRACENPMIIQRMGTRMVQSRIRQVYLAILYHIVAYTVLKQVARAFACNTADDHIFEKNCWYFVYCYIIGLLLFFEETSDQGRTLQTSRR
jgi:hypothetical protein